MSELFLNKIVYTPNLIFENVNKLICSKKKIGVYGNGIYATRLTERLDKWSILVDYYVVDDIYYQPTMKDNIIKLSELKKYDNSILIIGFETLIGKESILRSKMKEVLKYAPGIEILDFEHCYIDYDAITYEYILEHHKEFQETYDMLADDFSRRVMVEYLNNCISGRSKNFCLLNQDYIHDYDYEILLPKNGNGGVIIECGAFTGKTAVEIAEYINNDNINNTILALEPDNINYNILCAHSSQYDNIIPIKQGVAEHDGQVVFDEQGGSGSTIINQAEITDSDIYSRIQVCSIDSLMKKYGDIYAVMMDIEGSELDALKGAHTAYKKCRPLFAVRVYHKKNDLYTIPQFFNSLDIDCKYNLYLRNSQNTRGPLDLTLYAL